MSNISKAFDHGKAFIGFVTGGDPTVEKTEEFILAMVRAGADLVEIGIPFSDPIAEGVVIQDANIRALKAGATVAKMFDIVQNVRKQTDVPIVFLTYFNPVFKFKTDGNAGIAGTESFLKRCGECGVDGIIIPDLPFEESGEVKQYAAKYNVDLISLIAPTSKERIAAIARSANGFIYVVSSMGVTGVRAKIETDLGSILKTIKDAARSSVMNERKSEVPAAVGFGINTPQQAKEISKIADGVIVGSAIVKIVERYGADAASHLGEYVSSMKNAMSS
ncbi:MAG: tryptophan synthase subunit alpha [Termitinemataceae bacterium]|nr:MAG: tryptophan synthase subunit alpha [Termitinemataceae bacterium]